VPRPKRPLEEIVEFIIEPMRADQCEAILELWRSSPGVGVSPDDSPVTLRRFLERNPDLSQVAMRDGKIVGAALCGHDGRRGYLTHLAVRETHRRNGVGRALVDACVGALTREGIEKCHIFVYRDNAGAQAFWRAGGWMARDELELLSLFTNPDG
jgi:ribosomal protein S18 acetylase RimI-like enzyme